LSAVDIDAGRFGQVRYHIASVTGGAENLFDYDNSTSTLMATGPLSPASSYQVGMHSQLINQHEIARLN
uniref:Uncharacterized protein n=1 Tax=Plectus sambesii TaxID=2011161 RepID=A0A914V993_9BILA